MNTMSAHAIRCKRTGEAIGMKLDGGSCACESAEVCPLIQVPRPQDETIAELKAMALDQKGTKHD